MLRARQQLDGDSLLCKPAVLATQEECLYAVAISQQQETPWIPETPRNIHTQDGAHSETGETSRSVRAWATSYCSSWSGATTPKVADGGPTFL